jgi:hypothetical protein
LTYPDSLGGDLHALGDLLDGPLAGFFHGVHVLPPFPSSGDRGFAPITYREIEPRFGTWGDIERLSEHHDVLLDVMINHLSRQSPEFLDFQRHGRRSASADLFITLDKVWPDGNPADGDVARIFLRKPESPFSTVTIEDSGGQERIWTSFGSMDWSEQIDLDVTSAATRSLITGWLRDFAAHGVCIVRLDAVGYVIKKPGTTCFMVEPEIYDFLDWIAQVAASFGLVVLPEVHDTYATHERLAAHGFWTYDFVLPALLLNTTDVGSGKRVVISPFDIDPAHPRDRDLCILANLKRQGKGADQTVESSSIHIPLSTAAFASARFPWVTPASTVTLNNDCITAHPKARLVDGGYVENSGVETALDLIEKLKTVQGTSDAPKFRIYLLSPANDPWSPKSPLTSDRR